MTDDNSEPDFDLVAKVLTEWIVSKNGNLSDGSAKCYIIIGFTGMKPDSNSILPNRYEYTYIIQQRKAHELCAAPSRELGQFTSGRLAKEKTTVVVDNFMRFWRLCGDECIERRLLVLFFCVKRGFEEVFQVARRASPQSDPNTMEERIIPSEFVLDILQRLRGLFVAEKNNSDGGDEFLRSFAYTVIRVGPELDSPLNERLALNNCFGRAIESALVKKSDSPYQQFAGFITSRLSNDMKGPLVDCFQRMYLGWASLDVRNLKEFRKKFALPIPNNTSMEDLQERYLRSVRAAVPRWRKEDRAFIMQATENAGKPCDENSSYADWVLRDVGMEKFKLIAFGREKFCANCGRSSYTGSERLWSCKRCVVERVHPKARYCDVQCQKANWLKHKAAIHACLYCGRVPNAGEEQQLRACKRCKGENVRPPARYCNGGCQKADWPSHKADVHASAE